MQWMHILPEGLARKQRGPRETRKPYFHDAFGSTTQFRPWPPQ
jgi:hypothetical protein